MFIMMSMLVCLGGMAIMVAGNHREDKNLMVVGCVIVAVSIFYAVLNVLP